MRDDASCTTNAKVARSWAHQNLFLHSKKRMQSLKELQKVELSLSPEKSLAKYGMSTCAVLGDGKPLHVKVLDSISDDLYTPFAPSAFGGGTGEDCERLGLALAVPSDVADAFLVFEARVRDLLRKEHPKIDSMWNSSIKESDGNFDALLKTKIQHMGPRSVVFFGEDKEALEEPENWKAVSLNTCILVRGVYLRKDSAGLQLDTTHVQYRPRLVVKVENPF
jgi:hypothetical protein